MVPFCLFVAGHSVDPDPRHYRCLLPHLEACRMADAALSGVGCVRGISESGGVVAEPMKEFSKNETLFHLFNLIAKRLSYKRTRAFIVRLFNHFIMR